MQFLQLEKAIQKVIKMWTIKTIFIFIFSECLYFDFIYLIRFFFLKNIGKLPLTTHCILYTISRSQEFIFGFDFNIWLWLHSFPCHEWIFFNTVLCVGCIFNKRMQRNLVCLDFIVMYGWIFMNSFLILVVDSKDNQKYAHI